jgi:glycerol transport system ATP-binding protein
MANILLDGIAHSYDPGPTGGGPPEGPGLALKSLQHEWLDGGAYALLGPSGCGKTTLLNIISGLLTPSHGRVLFDGVDVTALPPQQRNIAQVFQFPVVYETMTVAENLAFPLRNRGMSRADAAQRVDQVLSALGIESLAARKASSLGAEAKQIVSLGRGLVRTDASAILFDEPLTVIDPALKWELRAQLKKIHQQFNHTMIYVTHDQTEALTFADKVVVMREGEVLQVGTPQELFDTPAHTFVGKFIGSPGMNVLPCAVEGAHARIGSHFIALSGQYGAPPGELELGVRPEHVQLLERGVRADALPVSIASVDDLGRHKVVHLRLDDWVVQALLPEDMPLPLAPAILLQPERVKIYGDSQLVAPQ